MLAPISLKGLRMHRSAGAPAQQFSRCARHVRRCQPAAAVDAKEASMREYLEGQAGLKVMLYAPCNNFQGYQADRLLRELGKKPEVDVEWLQSRMQGLVTAFGPGAEAEVAAAVYNGGLGLLEQDAALFPKQLIALKEALPGVNVISVVSREPRLLYTPNIAATSKKVITKLTSIYPYKSPNKKQDVLAMVAEYPELLVRMQYYTEDMNIKKVQDLPVDLQNRILKSYC